MKESAGSVFPVFESALLSSPLSGVEIETKWAERRAARCARLGNETSEAPFT